MKLELYAVGELHAKYGIAVSIAAGLLQLGWGWELCGKLGPYVVGE